MTLSCTGQILVADLDEAVTIRRDPSRERIGQCASGPVRAAPEGVNQVKNATSRLGWSHTDPTAEAH